MPIKYLISISFCELNKKSILKFKLINFCNNYKLHYTLIQKKKRKIITILKSPHVNKRFKENFNLFKIITKIYLKSSLKILYFINKFFYSYNKKIKILN